MGSAGYSGDWRNLGGFTFNLFSGFTKQKKKLWRCGWDIDLEKVGGIIRCLYAHVNSKHWIALLCE